MFDLENEQQHAKDEASFQNATNALQRGMPFDPGERASRFRDLIPVIRRLIKYAETRKS